MGHKGVEQYFTEQYWRHNKRLKEMIRMMYEQRFNSELHDVTFLEDWTQDVWLQAWTSRNTIKTEHFEKWLETIAARTMIKQFKRASQVPFIDEENQ